MGDKCVKDDECGCVIPRTGQRIAVRCLIQSTLSRWGVSLDHWVS